jgi:hypothetical protein
MLTDAAQESPSEGVDYTHQPAAGAQFEESPINMLHDLGIGGRIGYLSSPGGELD